MAALSINPRGRRWCTAYKRLNLASYQVKVVLILLYTLCSIHVESACCIVEHCSFGPPPVLNLKRPKIEGPQGASTPLSLVPFKILVVFPRSQRGFPHFTFLSSISDPKLKPIRKDHRKAQFARNSFTAFCSCDPQNCFMFPFPLRSFSFVPLFRLKPLGDSQNLRKFALFGQCLGEALVGTVLSMERN